MLIITPLNVKLPPCPLRHTQPGVPSKQAVARATAEAPVIFHLPSPAWGLHAADRSLARLAWNSCRC